MSIITCTQCNHTRHAAPCLAFTCQCRGLTDTDPQRAAREVALELESIAEDVRETWEVLSYISKASERDSARLIRAADLLIEFAEKLVRPGNMKRPETSSPASSVDELEKTGSELELPSSRHAAAQPPSIEQLQDWSDGGSMIATDGCGGIEDDGTCEHGAKSWMLELGLI